MRKLVTIESPVSESGKPVLGRDVKVFTRDGSQITGITGLTVKYDPKDVVRASIDLLVTPDTIQAHAMLSLESVTEAARLHGYALVPLATDNKSLADCVEKWK